MATVKGAANLLVTGQEASKRKGLFRIRKRSSRKQKVGAMDEAKEWWGGVERNLNCWQGQTEGLEVRLIEMGYT